MTISGLESQYGPLPLGSICGVKLQHLGPVFTKRGPREQQVAFRVTDFGADATFPGAEDGPAWSKSFPWTYVAEVSVGVSPDGALLFIDSYRFRFQTDPWTK